MLENEYFINRLDKLIPSLVISSPIQKERIFKTIREKKEIRQIDLIQTTSENYILEDLYNVSFLAPLFPNKTYFKTYKPNLNNIEKEIIDDNKYKTAGIFEAFMTKIDDQYLQVINNKRNTNFLRSNSFNEPERFCKKVIIDNNKIKINEESLFINKDFQKRTNNRLLLQVKYDSVIIDSKPTDVYKAFRYFVQEKYSSMNIADNVSNDPYKMEKEGLVYLLKNISNSVEKNKKSDSKNQEDTEALEYQSNLYFAILTLLQKIPDEKKESNIKIELWEKDDITEKKVKDIINYNKKNSDKILSSEELKTVKKFLQLNYFGNDFSGFYENLNVSERIQKCKEIINKNKSSDTKVESNENDNYSERAQKAAETKRLKRIQEIIVKYEQGSHSSFDETYESVENETRTPLDQTDIINDIRFSIKSLVEESLRNSNNSVINNNLTSFSEDIYKAFELLINEIINGSRKTQNPESVIKQLMERKNVKLFINYIEDKEKQLFKDIENGQLGRKILRKDLHNSLLRFFSTPDIEEYFKTIYILQTKGE